LFNAEGRKNKKSGCIRVVVESGGGVSSNAPKDAEPKLCCGYQQNLMPMDSSRFLTEHLHSLGRFLQYQQKILRNTKLFVIVLIEVSKYLHNILVTLANRYRSVKFAMPVSALKYSFIIVRCTIRYMY
jgi:hypothetical protein